MEIAMIGLGRMGGNMATRLLRHGHRVLVYDRSEDAIRAREAEGAIGAPSLQALLNAFQQRPRVVWVMVPAGKPTTDTIQKGAGSGGLGGIGVDGGDTHREGGLPDGAYVKAKGLN